MRACTDDEGDAEVLGSVQDGPGAGEREELGGGRGEGASAEGIAAAGLRLEGGGGARKEGRDAGGSALSNADEDGGVGPIMWMSGRCPVRCFFLPLLRRVAGS